MLLARGGLRVVAVDRAVFPSDTISGHMIKPAGIAALARWGLLDRLRETGCPVIAGRHVQGGEQVAALPAPPAGALAPMAPRRHVLDRLLVDAAREAGADVRERHAVTGLLRDGDRVSGVEGRDADGAPFRLRAELVIGADGRNSPVARWAGAEVTTDLGHAAVAYYAYWDDFPCPGIELYLDAGRAVGLFPTHGGQTLVFVQRPVTGRAEFKADLEGNYRRTIDAFEALRPRTADARGHGRILGMAELPNFFRRPHGPGWALVGDAGHHKDPLVARGIADAWRDSELLADAVLRSWGDRDRLDAALEEYEHLRDEASRDVARRNAELAQLDRPPAELLAGWMALAAAEAAAEQLVAGRARR
jgi:2-polyprenyl-6-methoxyphenol hydroxylase-like FAD-dependent oxidoreductase